MLTLYYKNSMFYHVVYDKHCQNTLLRFNCIARRSSIWWKLCLLIHQNNAYLFGLFPTPLQFNPFLHFIKELYRFIKAPEDLGGYRYLAPSKVALRYTASLNKCLKMLGSDSWYNKSLQVVIKLYLQNRLLTLHWIGNIVPGICANILLLPSFSDFYLAHTQICPTFSP